MLKLEFALHDQRKHTPQVQDINTHPYSTMHNYLTQPSPAQPSTALHSTAFRCSAQCCSAVYYIASNTAVAESAKHHSSGSCQVTAWRTHTEAEKPWLSIAGFDTAQHVMLASKYLVTQHSNQHLKQHVLSLKDMLLLVAIF